MNIRLYYQILHTDNLKNIIYEIYFLFISTNCYLLIIMLLSNKIFYTYKKLNRIQEKRFNMNSSLPLIFTSNDCNKLYSDLQKDNAICLWATGAPIQSVEIMLYFKHILEKYGHKVVLLIRKSGTKLFPHFCKNKNEKFVFECNNINIFEWCPFFKILFTHDYCLQTKPKYFYGKIVLFPHNANTLYPRGDISLCADYIVSSMSIQNLFDFKKYPNTIKKSSSQFQTIIPGNPKFDILISKFNSKKNHIYKRISFYPTASWITNKPLKVLYEEYTAMIESFFKKYPQWEFILRPRSEDVNSKLYISIKNKFNKYPNFIFDISNDNYKYLSISDFCITDYSGISKNFAFCSLRPIIRIHIDNNQKNIKKDDIGYFIYKGEHILIALDDAFTHLHDWEKQIDLSRKRQIPNIGATCTHICEHIDDMLNNRKVKEWIYLDKHDTPSQSAKDYIKLIVHSDNSLYTNYPILDILTWSQIELGGNSKVALAGIKKYVSLWPQKYVYATLLPFKSQIDLAFNLVFPEQAIKLLKYLVKKNPLHMPSRIFLAESLSRWQPQDPFLKSFFANIIAILPNNFFLCVVISRLLRLHIKSSYISLIILELHTPGLHEKIPSWIYPIYAGLLFETNNNKFKEVITTWKGFSELENIPLSLFIFEILEKNSQKGKKLPTFFG